jgi:hypothetical protein
MAIDHRGTDHFIYGRSWYYGKPHLEAVFLFKGIGFDRPECKKEAKK